MDYRKEIYEELLCGTTGVDANQMNIYVVAKATQGLANYLGAGTSVVIGYGSSIKSHAFANCAASVLAANGIKVWIWPEQALASAVPFAVRRFKASAGIMITLSQNPSEYNGYKVYGSDGCPITMEAAAAVLAEILAIDTFADVQNCEFLDGVQAGRIEYIPDTVMTAFIEEVKGNAR